MTRKKTLVKTKTYKTKEDTATRKKEILLLIELVEIVRRSRKKTKADIAFSEITKILKIKIDQLVYRFTIPGSQQQDVRQEALFALRYKAIKDYDQSRSLMKDISPFDKFAMLCMRRHLATKLKAAFQNKSRALTDAVSLDRDRGSSERSEENLFLSDIIPHPGKDVAEQIKDKEYFRLLMGHLCQKLSSFEKEVLRLYSHRYSYNEIADIINRRYKKKMIEVKSIDNALSRIKNKAKDVVEKFGEED
jgi:DNA-directed RNA polymerase specialized sigma24 family protein